MMISDILRGSTNEKIIRHGLESLSTWGIMKDTSAQRIRTILDYLIDEGILILEEGEYPVVTLGNAGPLLREERRLVMKLPQEREKFSEPEHEVRKTTKSVQSVADLDQVLLDRLRKLRNEIAKKDSVPSYIVFTEASLLDMCRKMPVSLVQFSGVNGVGQVKLEKYGEVFTNLIRDYVKR
jgi:ATP-dependent DNA helicase RecQ